MSAAPVPATAGRWSRAGRAAAVVAFVAAGAYLARREAENPPKLVGDAWEYWYMAESFHRHGTPELRPSDRQAVDAAVVGYDPTWVAPAAPYAYAQAPSGAWYGVHFWAYSLSAAPAKAVLEAAGYDGLNGLRVANVGWFLFGVGVALFGSRAPVAERAALVGLSAAGAVQWYLAWPGAEMFTWALVLAGTVAFRDGRYGWAGLAAGLAATQNPPAVFLGAAAVAAAVLARSWAAAARAAAGTALVFAPFAFFVYHFGRPSLIATGDEYVGVRNLSWVRTWGLAMDPDQGLVAYLPVLVAAAAAGAVGVVWRRDRPGLLLLAAGLGMALGVQVAHNWNSGCPGLQRYVMWMTPVAAGVAVGGVGGTRRLWAVAVAAAAAHTAAADAYERADALRGGELDHNPVAAWVLTHAPRLYWPDPEVFVERGQHRDGWPHAPADFPIAFARPDGVVTKVLIGPGDADKFAARYDIDPGYLEAVRAEAGRRTGIFYLHPPEGAVKVRAGAAR
jgi:hypothetical protein